MPSIQVRSAVASDIPLVIEMDHNYTTEYVWQMDLQVESERIQVNFRKSRLPRSVRQAYPNDVSILADEWTKRSGLLVAEHEGIPVGYISLMLGAMPEAALVTDLAVRRRLRRQGIGTALLLAGQEWAEVHTCRQVILVMQSKNYPALCLAQKLGYDFCGYSDRYYANQDIALLFSKSLR